MGPFKAMLFVDLFCEVRSILGCIENGTFTGFLGLANDGTVHTAVSGFEYIWDVSKEEKMMGIWITSCRFPPIDCGLFSRSPRSYPSWMRIISPWYWIVWVTMIGFLFLERIPFEPLLWKREDRKCPHPLHACSRKLVWTPGYVASAVESSAFFPSFWQHRTRAESYRCSSFVDWTLMDLMESGHTI